MPGTRPPEPAEGVPSHMHPETGELASDSTSPDFPRMAPHPFNKPDADVILRTSDNVEFRVRSHILIEASPVLEKMLARRKSSAESDTATSRRVIDLTEDSTTTETWLLLIYPVFQDPSFWSRMDLLKAQAILHATAEYQILAVQSAIAHYLARKAGSGNGRRWFVICAIACRHRLEELAAIAASHMTLRDTRPAILPLDDLEHLEGISAGDYYRLLRYHRKSGKVDQEYRFLQDPSPKQEPRVPYIPVQVPFPNLICRSSDVVEYRVRKEPLSAASPVIRVKVEVAEAVRARALSSTSSSSSDSEEEASDDGLPSIQLDHSAAALSVLFHFYSLGTFEHLPSEAPCMAEVLAAARAYGMHALAEVARTRWTAVAEKSPLRAYLAAITHGLDDCAKDAAGYTLGYAHLHEYISDLEDVPALPYHRLLSYHEACLASAMSALPKIYGSPTKELRQAYLGYILRGLLSIRRGDSAELLHCLAACQKVVVAFYGGLWFPKCRPLPSDFDFLKALNDIDKVVLEN